MVGLRSCLAGPPSLSSPRVSLSRPSAHIGSEPLHRSYRQIQLHGTLDLLLLACGDMLPDNLRCPFHAFGGYLQIGEQFHPLASMVKSRRLAHQRLHPPHSRRGFRILNVQFDVGGELAVMTVGAQVVGTPHFPAAYASHERLDTHFLLSRPVP